MLRVHDGDRCCLSQEHLVMWECLKPVSSCQENPFHCCLMHEPSNSRCWPDTGVHRRTPQVRLHLGRFWQATLQCFLFYSDIADINLSVTGTFTWQHLASFPGLISSGLAILINDPFLSSKSLRHKDLTTRRTVQLPLKGLGMRKEGCLRDW